MPPGRKSPENTNFAEMNSDKSLFLSADDDRGVKLKVEGRILCVNRQILCKHAYGFLQLLRENSDCDAIELKDKRFEDVYEFLQCMVPFGISVIDESNVVRLTPLINEFHVTDLHRDSDRVVCNMVDDIVDDEWHMVDILLFAVRNNLPEAIRKLILRCAFISQQQCDKLVQYNPNKYKSVVFYLTNIVKQQLDNYRRNQTHKILFNVCLLFNKEGKTCDRCPQNGRLFYCQICKKYFCSAHCAGCDNFCTHCENCSKEIPPKFNNKFKSGIEYCFCAVRLSNKVIGRMVRSKMFS